MAFALSENKNLNKGLLWAGLAWHHKKYSRDPELAKLEFRACSKKGVSGLKPTRCPPGNTKRKKALNPGREILAPNT